MPPIVKEKSYEKTSCIEITNKVSFALPPAFFFFSKQGIIYDICVLQKISFAKS